MQKVYIDELPRQLPKGYKTSKICQHLDKNGARCFNTASIEAYSFEGTGREIDPDEEINWHIVFYCDKHAGLRRIKHWRLQDDKSC